MNASVATPFPITVTQSTDGKLHIDLQVDGNGERLPPVIINAVGGTLDVYVKDVTRSGNISVHLWG